MLSELTKYLGRPKLYTPSSAPFWDDEHISKRMLAAHLDPEWEAASRSHAFIDKSVEWISSILPAKDNPRLLDLGCGPGLYAERFCRKGYQVTGVDLSPRSINYARASAAKQGLEIIYVNQDYLDLSVDDPFDIAVLIYRDYGALSDTNRARILAHAYQALKPNGHLILDVFTPLQYQGKGEARTWEFKQEGFWRPEPYLCLESFHRYDDSNTLLTRYIVITDTGVDCYNIWDHTFEVDDLRRELNRAGFADVDIYGDAAGAEYQANSTIICAVAKKMTRASNEPEP
jgi:SAM-dependent methyltransferase